MITVLSVVDISVVVISYKVTVPFRTYTKPSSLKMNTVLSVVGIIVIAIKMWPSNGLFVVL